MSNMLEIVLWFILLIIGTIVYIKWMIIVINKTRFSFPSPNDSLYVAVMLGLFIINYIIFGIIIGLIMD